MIKGGFRGLYGYMERTIEENPALIEVYEKPICDLANYGKILAIRGDQVRECLQQSSGTLIYLWKPACKGSACLPPELLQAFAQDQKLDLYIIAQSYYDKELSKDYDIKRPIFGINCRHYQTNFTSSYVNRFIKDLVVNPDLYQFDKGNFLLLVKDSLTQQTGNMYNLQL